MYYVYKLKMSFSGPPYTKNAIFETPLYKKLAFLRPPYTKKKIPSSPPSPFLNGIALIAFLQWEALYIFTFHGRMAGYEVKEKKYLKLCTLNTLL